MSRQSFSAVLLALTLASCAPRVSVDLLSSRPKDWDYQRVAVIDENAELPSSAVKLGEVTAEDAPLSASHYNVVLSAAAEEVWKQGGNVLQVTQSSKTPFFAWKGDCSVKGNMLYVPCPDSLAVVRYVNTMQAIYPLGSNTWELSLSVSGKPVYAGIPAMDYKPEEGCVNTKPYGLFSLLAAWQFHPRWAVTGSVGYSHFDYREYRADAWNYTGNGDVATAFAGVRFYHVSRPAFKLYSAVQAGAFFWFKNLDSPVKRNWHLGGQVTWLGMQFGRKWFFDWELLGVGDYYTVIIPLAGGRIGVGYRF